MNRRGWALVASVAFVSSVARAQGVPGEIVPPGETAATSTDADAARLNPGAIALERGFSVRATAVGEFQNGTPPLDAAAITFTSPIVFGLAGSGAAFWQHVVARPGQPVSGDVAGTEVGLAYPVLPGLGVGTRLRVMGGGGDPLFAPLANGAATFDVGVVWRPLTWFALAVGGNDLVGPRVPLIGLDRSIVGGIGFRPTGTDAFTIGVDGSYAQAGTGWIRAGVRVRVPYVGYARAEGVVDLPAETWRASAGLEFTWGTFALGGGVLVGGNADGIAGGSRGGFATLRYDEERDRGLPEPGVVIEIPLEETLGSRSLSHLILRLERLRQDPSVRGILFAPRGDVSGIANAEALREAFTRLRASGVHVACHLIEPNGSAYDACTAAESITMDSAGTLRAAGIRSGYVFLGDALRDVGVRAEFVRIGAWKSAPEQFTRRGSTPEARAQEEQLLDDLYASFLRDIAEGRRSLRGGAANDSDALAHVRSVIEAGPYSAREALRAGMIDAVGTREDAARSLALVAGGNVVRMDDYARLRRPRWMHGRTVAVVYVDGDMIDGESFEVPFIGLHFVGDRTIVATIDRLAGDPDVRAIVLRIDSGGGSATSGEMMWRAIQRAARTKPVVVSMGSEAASAGYYIAAPAREIVAEPATITGSIGIFFGKADVSTLLGRIDVGVELLRRGARADMDSEFRPWTSDERAIVGRLIREFYNQFLDRVASGRHMTTAAVDAIGEGRVFSATRAMQLHLVDRLGGLDLAVDRARALAGLGDDYDVVELPEPQGGLLATLATLFTGDRARSPEAMLLAQSELRFAAGWLYAIAAIGQGHALAMTEWPLLPP